MLNNIMCVNRDVYIQYVWKQLQIAVNYEVAHADIDLHTVGTGPNCFGLVGPLQCRLLILHHFGTYHVYLLLHFHSFNIIPQTITTYFILLLLLTIIITMNMLMKLVLQWYVC